MEKKQAISAALFSVAFLASLGVVMAVTISGFGETYSYFENRDLAEAPAWSLEEAGNGQYFTNWETTLCDHAAFRTDALKLQTMADLNILHKPVVNETVVTDDVLLTYFDENTTFDEEEIVQQAEDMATGLDDISRLVEGYGGTFLYVSMSNQYYYFADSYPNYLNNREEWVDTIKEHFLADLDAHDVNYIDIGAAWEEEGSPSEYVSTVDHHQTWAGNWSAYQLIMSKLNDLTGNSLPVLTEDDVNVITLPNEYLGSLARKVYGLWSSGEKLSYAELKEPIAFTRYNNGTLVDSTTVSLPASEDDYVTYNCYMGGDIGETIIQTGRSELPDMLIYGDSYTNPMETILYASCDEFRSLDFRAYAEKTLSEYIKEYQPDVVVCVRGIGHSIDATGNGTTS